MTASHHRRASDPLELRREFLRGLPEVGFVPAESFTILPSPEVQALRSEIDAFGERFWSTPPGERQSEWLALSARAESDPPSRLRLEQMRRAIELSPAGDGKFTGAQESLVSTLKELSVLRPPQRAAARAEFLRNLAPPHRLWQRAAEIVRETRPDIAALDRTLLDRIAALGAGQSYTPRGPIPASFSETAAAAGWSLPISPPDAPAEPGRKPAKRGSDPSRSTKGVPFVLILLVMGIVRACTNMAVRNDGPQISKPLPVIPDSFRVPPHKSKGVPKLDWEQDEIRKFIEESGRSKTQPPKSNPWPGSKPP
jgi:hypothetical protein